VGDGDALGVRIGKLELVVGRRGGLRGRIPAALDEAWEFCAFYYVSMIINFSLL